MAGSKPLAVVTGAGRGIGRATAKRLAEDGFGIAVLDLDRALADGTAHEIVSAGGAATAHQIDVRDEAACDTVLGSLGPIAALVNNAGIFDVRMFDDVTADDFRRMFEINLIPLFLMTRTASRAMQRGGKVVNLASRAYLGAPNYAHYVASKGAVASLTRGLALELAPKGIMVNAIAPGPIATDMVKARVDIDKAALAAQQPLGVLGEPEDIANAISFLASPRTAFITGQILLVDGGRSLGGFIG
jgi:3-oxoacyl-[acyl-carrier protein] reductase